jgi:hypothetical protein
LEGELASLIPLGSAYNFIGLKADAFDSFFTVLERGISFADSFGGVLTTL